MRTFSRLLGETQAKASVGTRNEAVLCGNFATRHSCNHPSYHVKVFLLKQILVQIVDSKSLRI